MDKSAIRILVLDDEPFMLKLHARTLGTLGYTTVTTCESGMIALEHVNAAGTQPDLILLDLNMPEMDGIEFIRKLVQHDYAGSLILVSGEDERVLQAAEKLALAHEITMLGHICKPVTLVGLSTILDKWAPARPHQSARKTYPAQELRAAIDNGELVNFYQPKVSVATGDVVGIETLVRWRHPVDGMVYPDQFIGLAEEHGLIDDLTRAVLKAALDQVKTWRQAGIHLRVAVNVSMDNLLTLEFADYVSCAAAIAPAIAPQDIVLEVTESRLMMDMRAPLEILTRLRLKRFRLSIDDFGTGNSSFTQLCNIPFDELKIDQSFVHGAWHDATARVIYDASLGLGKGLGMEVVAEGVEDQDDWQFVRSTKCDIAQGYFISRPMPASDFVAWLASWSERRIQLYADVDEVYNFPEE